VTDLTYNLNGGFKPTMKIFADLSGPDFFPTPAWATFALIEEPGLSGNKRHSGNGLQQHVGSRD
jgi:hypothetical protein